MTYRNRSRQGPNDWREFSARTARLHLLGQQVLAGGIDSLAPDDREWYEAQCAQPNKARVPPVRREAADTAHVARVAETRWWGQYLQRHDSAHDWRTGGQQRAEGHAPGWPDFTLHVGGVSAALELKAGPHPPTERAGWWLHVTYTESRGPDGKREWRIVFPSGAEQASRHGIDAAQARWLRILHDCGWRTAVCYGAEEALAQLEAWAAGP